MKEDLISLLARRTVCHPSRITRIEQDRRGMTISVEGYPWWLGEKPGRDHGNLAITLTGIDLAWSSFFWAADEYDCDEDLDTFRAEYLFERGFSRNPRDTVYCNDPLPDPLALISVAEQVMDEVDCPFSVWDLFRREGMSDFLGTCQAQTFLLADAFPALRAALVMELERQGVRHSVVEGPAQTNGHDELLVRFLYGHILCRTAYAEWS